MNYYEKVSVIDGKLTELLSENNLVHEFKDKTYPIVLEIAPDASPEAQMEIYSTADSTVSSVDARLRLIFSLDGSIEIQTNNRFVIPDALMGKIKNLGKKYLAAYTYAFYASIRGTGKDDENPRNSDDSEETGDYEEFYEDEDDQDEEENDGAEE